jgi:hypothetical protein
LRQTTTRTFDDDDDDDDANVDDGRWCRRDDGTRAR